MNSCGHGAETCMYAYALAARRMNSAGRADEFAQSFLIRVHARVQAGHTRARRLPRKQPVAQHVDAVVGFHHAAPPAGAGGPTARVPPDSGAYECMRRGISSSRGPPGPPRQ